MNRRWMKHLFFGLLVLTITLSSTMMLVAQEGADEAGAAGTEAPPGWVELILIRGGAIAWLIIALSVLLIFMAIDNFMKIKESRLVPEQLKKQILQFIQQRRLDQLAKVIRGNDTYLTRILARGLDEFQGGYPSMKQAMEEAGEEETIRLNQRINWLAMLGSISPMLGLFGTVFGMMEAFRGLAAAGAAGPNAADLAASIHVALVTTFLGLFVAMPAILFYNIFRNRVILYSLEAGGFCEQFLRLLRRVFGTQLVAAAGAAGAQAAQQGQAGQGAQTPPPSQAQQAGQPQQAQPAQPAQPAQEVSPPPAQPQQPTQPPAQQGGQPQQGQPPKIEPMDDNENNL